MTTTHKPTPGATSRDRASAGAGSSQTVPAHQFGAKVPLAPINTATPGAAAPNPATLPHLLDSRASWLRLRRAGLFMGGV
jgi:hypothetical protein